MQSVGQAAETRKIEAHFNFIGDSDIVSSATIPNQNYRVLLFKSNGENFGLQRVSGSEARQVASNAPKLTRARNTARAFMSVRQEAKLLRCLISEDCL
jgi:hypothetical protein